MQEKQTAIANPPTPKAFSGWHENPSEQKAFLDLVNYEGFPLEDAVHEILSRCPHRAELHPGEVFEGAPHRGGGRVEIDLWAKIRQRIFLIESKRSDYDLVFLKNNESAKDIHIINGQNSKISVTNRNYNHLPCVSKQVVEVLEADETPTLQRQKGKPHLPLRSSREEYVRGFLRQALFNMEVLLHSKMSDQSWEKEWPLTFIPLIVTNAKVFSGTYVKSDIDDDAKLAKIDLQPIKVAAFNHAEILKWGATYEKCLSHIGQPVCGNRVHADERYIGSHIKTVFIVSKNHLLEFIDHTMNWT